MHTSDITMASRNYSWGNKILPLFLVFMLGFIEIHHCEEEIFSSHEEFCNSTIRCLPESNLFCNPLLQSCSCVRPSQMSFDENLKKCLIRPGESCRFEFMDGSSRKLYEKFDCYDGFECKAEDYICKCPQNSFLSMDGKSCIMKKSAKESCTTDDECNSELSLVCDQGICQCNQKTYLSPEKFSFSIKRVRQYRNPNRYYSYNRYDYEDYEHNVEVQRFVCLAKVDEDCNNEHYEFNVLPYINQEHGLMSSVNETDLNPIGCVSGAKCLSGKCYCEVNTVPSSDKTKCLQPYNGICHASDECQEGLTCINNQCSCPNYPYEMYHGSMCTPRLGAPCTPQLNTDYVFRDSCFDSHAVCKTISGEINRCMCKDGYIEETSHDGDVDTADRPSPPNGRSCKVDFGGSCDNGDQCYRGLSCVDRKCLCGMSMDIYDEKSKTCRRPVAVACDMDEDCTVGAYCAPNTEYGNGKHCVCGWSAISQDGSCVLPSEVTIPDSNIAAEVASEDIENNDTSNGI